MAALLRVPRERRVHATCRTEGCTRRGLDLLPTLRTCPGCGQQLAPFRGARS